MRILIGALLLAMPAFPEILQMDLTIFGMD